MLKGESHMRGNHIVKRLVVFLMLIALFLNCNAFSCFASNKKQVEMGASSVEFYDGYVIEKNEIIINDEPILIERITYENNKSVFKVKENNEWTITQMTVDYKTLILNLTSNTVSKGLRTAGRLEERYVTSFKSTEYFGPIYGTYANVVSAIGTILGAYSIPVAVASYIASAIINNSSSPVKGHVTINRHFYGVYDSTGSFLGYYNVAYSVYTYVENTLVDTEAGTYQSLSVG